MTDTQLALATLVIGGVLSWLVTWIYFRKSIRKRLSVYIQTASGVLEDVDDPTIRNAIHITYGGAVINDLYQLQFVVANEGQRAIRDVIEPLTLLLPAGVQVLDARVMHVEPKGRAVDVTHHFVGDGTTSVRVVFPVLNASEFFVVKLLLNGRLRTSQVTFSLSAEDLPPTLVAKDEVFRPSETPPISGKPAILLGVLYGIACWSVAYSFARLRETKLVLGLGDPEANWMSTNTIWALALILTAAYLGIRTLQMAAARGFFGPSRRFRIPRRDEGEANAVHRLLVVDESVMDRDTLEALRQSGAIRQSRLLGKRRTDGHSADEGDP